jgi:hypothetical protein
LSGDTENKEGVEATEEAEVETVVVETVERPVALANAPSSLSSETDEHVEDDKDDDEDGDAGEAPFWAHDSDGVPRTPTGVARVGGASGGVIAVLPPAMRVLLRDHAAALAAAVDLGALAAFARETDFDCAVFFADEAANAEGGGAAHLDDFASALSIAADSLRRYTPGYIEGGGQRGKGLDQIGGGGVWSYPKP